MGSLLPQTLLSATSSISSSVKFALLPIAKVLAMCGAGYWLASPRMGILTPPGIKLLSKLVFLLFLPSLIFTELGSAITLQKMVEWWYIPVNVVVAAMVGSLIGSFVVAIVKPPPEFRKFTVIMIAIGNIGNIPLVLIDAICQDTSNPFGASDDCNELGVAYISFGQWVGAIIVYTLIYHLLSPMSTEGPAENGDAQASVSVPLLLSEEDVHAHGVSLERRPVLWRKKVSQAWQAIPFKLIFQPAVSASIMALIVGATPFLKSLLLADGAPLSFFSDSLSIFGSAMIPCIMLALGGNLAGGPGQSRLGTRTTIAITLTRLFIIPPVGLCVVLLADKLGFLPADNDLFRFVLLLQHTMPSSILVGSVAAMRGVADKEAAAVLFWEHILAVISVALWLAVYLRVLF